MIINITFFLTVFLTLILATVNKKDFYPFSRYPMFSTRYKVADVKIYRIALQDNKGNITWWKHQAYRYPEFIGRKMAACYNGLNNGDKTIQLLMGVQKQKLLIEIVRLISLQENNGENPEAIHIIERRINSLLQIENTTIEVILFNKIRYGKSN